MKNFHATIKHIRSLPAAFWVVIGATLLNQIGNMVIVFIILYLNQSLGFSLTQATLAFGTFSATMCIAGMLGGNFIDKIGAPRMMVTTLTANGCALLAFPLLHTLPMILCLCVVWGITFGLYRPASQTFVSQLSSSGMHKVTFSLYRLVLNLGMSIGPAVGGYLATFSYSYIFIANGIANIIAASVLMIGLYKAGWLFYKAPQNRKLEFNLKWLKHDKGLRLFVLGLIPVSMIFFQHEATLPVYMNENLHLQVGLYGLLFTINTLIIVFFELALNIATINWPYRLNFMLGSVLITAGFAGLYFATSYYNIIFLTVLWTFGEMILFPSASSYIADIAPEAHRGSYMSLYSTCSNLGMLFGPWCGALVMEHFGGNILWLACGLWGILSLLAFQQLREPKLEVVQA